MCAIAAGEDGASHGLEFPDPPCDDVGDRAGDVTWRVVLRQRCDHVDLGRHEQIVQQHASLPPMGSDQAAADALDQRCPCQQVAPRRSLPADVPACSTGMGGSRRIHDSLTFQDRRTSSACPQQHVFRSVHARLAALGDPSRPNVGNVAARRDHPPPRDLLPCTTLPSRQGVGRRTLHGICVSRCRGADDASTVKLPEVTAKGSLDLNPT